jgi:hypothetical protein
MIEMDDETKTVQYLALSAVFTALLIGVLMIIVIYGMN